MTVMVTTPLRYFEPKTEVLPKLVHICYFVPTLIRTEFLFQCSDPDCGKVLPYEEGLRRLNVQP